MVDVENPIDLVVLSISVAHIAPSTQQVTQSTACSEERGKLGNSLDGAEVESQIILCL